MSGDMGTEGNDELTASSGDRVQPSPDVLARRAGDEIVLVHVHTSRIYELNRTGSVFWGLLERGLTRAEIEEQMAREFDVDRSQLTAEVAELLEMLAAEDLIQAG